MHSGQIAIVFTMAPSFSLEKKYRRRELAESPFTVLAAKLFVYVIYETAVVAFCLAITLPLFYIMPSVLFSGAIWRNIFCVGIYRGETLCWNC